MNRRLWLCGLLVLAGALWLRWPGLDRRPMHNDEAINATKLQALWERGIYRYDPEEYHGPSLYYAALPFVWLSGTRDFDLVREGTLRLAPVFFGQTVAGAKMPSLTYMLGFKDRQESDDNWKKLSADPDWQKLQAMPEYADKEILRKDGITNLYLKPASYSQI